MFRKADNIGLLGVDYSRENTRDKDNAYQRAGGRLGWGQEWPWGISSRVTLSYAKRHYQAADFFNIRQNNREYASTLTLWHRDLYFWGITPKNYMVLPKSKK